ncbi:nonribosomal peptide synthetase [Bacillus sinesaloumensis]|uniref:SF0329 family protein n=1 Tax=Litchfieldia sinesaloumensis TaxID=1926280 RepID=UPI00098856F2|nr:nonribosomal peptide synthetase [Bacillus sinesaloumensis]
MKWSKTKATLEGFLCEKLRGRIQLHATVYRKFHDGPSRVWFTLDKKEIISASDTTYAVKHQKLYQQMQDERSLKAIPYNSDWDVMFNSKERQELVRASDDVEEILIDQSIFESYHLYSAFLEYGSLSIDEAMESENVIIRAYSMLDRRLGKRRLKKIEITQDTHPFILTFYKIRCEVEGVALL